MVQNIKVKDIVKHKITDEVGFVLCIREDLKNHCDVQWSFEIKEDDDLSYKDKCLINQGCYSFEELEVVYSI